MVATVDASGLVTGVAAGTASITYTVHNGSGCDNAASLTVTVNDVPVVEAITGTEAVCFSLRAVVVSFAGTRLRPER